MTSSVISSNFYFAGVNAADNNYFKCFYQNPTTQALPYYFDENHFAILEL